MKRLHTIQSQNLFFLRIFIISLIFICALRVGWVHISSEKYDKVITKIPPSNSLSSVRASI
ncbi:MAG: hypothetical protein SFU27_13610 [Thermonemataceae bacterium]|nr:hypothetical protein [Thermonemataceae bacterium]